MAILGDIRYALRLHARSPVFAVTAMLSLALGIGASGTIFSLTDALLLAPRAGVRAPGELVDIGRSTAGSGFDNMSHLAFRFLRDQAKTLEGMAALDFSGGPMSLSDGRSSERVFARMVSHNYFAVLGTRPALGRFFLPEEDRVAGEHPVAVLTHEFWMRRFAGDPGVLRRPLRLNNREFTVVGVAEPGFQGSSLIGTDLWVPTAMVAVARGVETASDLDNPRSVWHVAVGRMKPGVTRAQVAAELNTLMAAYKKAEPRANPRHGVAIEPMSRIPGPVRLPFLAFIGLLFALTGALLAIACSNVAGLLLARATARRREMATRRALGASRARLVAQLLTETLMLFGAAGAAGLLATAWLVRLLAGLLPALPVPIALELGVNLRVTLFAMSLALVTAVVFGLAPARHAIGGDLSRALHDAHATADRRRLRLRHSLVVAQVALSLMLVVTTLLFLRTLQNAARLDPGFETSNIQLASLDVALSGYRGQQAVDLVERIQERIAAISGVTSVATARIIPLQGSSFGLGRVRIPGHEGAAGTDGLDADWNIVSPGYFSTIRMRIVDGRAFSATDRDGAPMVAVVNQAFAKRAWPGRPAVGQRFMQHVSEGNERPVEVVGVVADAKYRYINDPETPFVFVPMAQQPASEVTLFVRHAEGRAVAREIRAAVGQVEPGVPVLVVQPLEEAAALGLLPQRLAAWIAGGVGTVGLLLAALGLYGLMAFLVAQRAREIAIRMTLGASGRDMRSMVLKQAARLGLFGGAIGFALAGTAGLLVRGLLVGVPPIDPVSMMGAGLLFAMVLAGASWIPARRAAATDPAASLKTE